MPWRDIAVKLQGDIVDYFTFHYVQYWNNSQIKIKDGKQNIYNKNQMKPI